MSTASFTTTPLLGNKALVRGTDRFGVTGQTVLDSTEFESLLQNSRIDEAKAEFDAAVEDFFSELTEASERLNDALTQAEEGDPAEYVVISEATEGSAATGRVIHKLGPDAIVLRIIAAGEFDRLVWVGDKLTVLASQVAEPIVVPDVEPDEPRVSPHGIDL